MRRVVALLVLFLVVGSATGAFAAMAEAAKACDEQCGDGDEDCCPLVCPRCVCAARSLAVDVPNALVMPGAEPSRQPTLGGDDGVPESAEPDEILHVPIVAG